MEQRKLRAIENWWRSGGRSISAEAQAVISIMGSQPIAYQNAIITFVDGQVAAGNWSKVLECWLWANDTQANSLKGFKGVVNSTLANTPTWNALTGITLNGTNQYIGGFIPNTHASGFAAKLACGAFIKENISTGNALSLFGVTLPGGTGRLELTQTPSSAAINMYANNASVLGVSEGTNDDKIFDSETEYTAVQFSGNAIMYKDGIQITSAARTNNGLATIEMTFGCQNNNGSKFQHINAKMCFGYFVDPTGFDFRAWHLGVKKLLQTLGVYSSTPELTIPTGGEWFDFSQSSLGTFSSLIGRKALLTCSGLNTPTVEAVSGVNMLRCNPTGSKAIDLSSVFQAFYDGALPPSFSILLTIKPNDGTPSAAQAMFGHTNITSGVMYARVGTDGKITIGFKEATQAAITTVTDYAAFNDTPSFVSILIFEFLKDEMIVYVNGIRVNQTESSWGTRLLTDFDGGTRNMYLGAENVDGTITNVLDGHIGDFMIRRGAWSQSQKERVLTYFNTKYSPPNLNLLDLDGQSNMGGMGDIATYLPAPYQGAQNVDIYFKTTRTSTDDGSWQALTPGTNNIDPELLPANNFGIESKLPKDLKDNLGWTVKVVKSARGGTTIGAHIAAGAEGITTFQYYLTPALSKLAKDGFIVHKATIMAQGYSNCTSAPNAASYGPDLQTWATDVVTFYRTKIFSQVEFNIVVVESPDYLDVATTPANVDVVQAFQLAFYSTGRKRYSIAKPSIVTFNGGPNDIHWDGASLIRYSDLIYNVVKNF